MAVDVAYYEQAELWGGDGNSPDQARTELRAREMAALFPESTRSILDVGTGDGRMLGPLIEEFDAPVDVVGLDRSAAALQHLEALDLRGVQSGAEALPFADRSFDVVIACEILEHLPEPIFVAACREFARVADRSVVITVPHRERLRAAEIDCSICGCRYNRRRHLRRFELSSFDGLLAGFDIGDSAEFGHRTRIYPRRARQSLERRGMLGVHDAPECPQCGNPHGRRVSSSTSSSAAPESNGPDRYWSLRRLVPAQRHPYWLGVRLDRVN